MKGFTFPYGRKDVFVVTERRNKLRKADCEKKTLSNGTEWISIKGDNFSAFMPLDDAIIIKLD